MKTLARTTRFITINAIIMGIGVILLELIFGNWVRPNHLNKLNLVKGVTKYFDASTLYDSGPKVRYARDKYGFRGQYPSTDRIDILTLGGSTTDQRYIGEGQTWQDVLAAQFRAEGKDVSVVNAGVDGQSSYGHNKNMDWWFPFVPDLKVKYYLLYIGGNDMHTDPAYDYDDLLSTENPSFRRAIKERSALYFVFRTLRGMYRASRVLKISHRRVDFDSEQWVEEPLSNNHAELARQHVVSYRQRLELLLSKIKDVGGIPICVTQASALYRRSDDGRIIGLSYEYEYDGVRVNGVDHYYLIQQFNDVTLSVCEEAGGICIDAANELEWDYADFYDIVHNTPAGAEKIGRHIYDRLKSHF